jgi:F-type H+-transporting ATPase subunit c
MACGAFSVALAQPAPSAGTDKAVESAAADAGAMGGKALGFLGACIGAGIAVFGGSFGIGRIGGQTIEGIARQPEAAGAMFAPMIITAAMVEGGMLFALVICILVLFK